MSENNGSILKVNNLKTYFQTEDGVVKAVDGITFELKKGETLGIVGESGSGKSVTNLSVMRLIPEPPGKIVGGDVIFNGIDVRKLSIDEVRGIRGKRIADFSRPDELAHPFCAVRLNDEGSACIRTSKQPLTTAKSCKCQIPIPKSLDRYPHDFPADAAACDDCDGFVIDPNF